MTQQGRMAGIVAILITSVLWGTTGTAATFAPEVGPVAIGAVALGIGGLLQAVIAAGALRRDLPMLRARWRLTLVGALAVMSREVVLLRAVCRADR